ncbi:MAG: amine dehydrogenase large subunit [Steroidobacterales bacterium]
MQSVLAATVVALSLPALAAGAQFPNPLPPDTMSNIATLPAKYPTDWAFLNFPYNRIELRNVGTDTREVKGELQARDSTVLQMSTSRPEIYVLDTVWSRGVRGARTDFIWVYDTKTLNVIDEIVIPTKRALVSAMSGTFILTDNERLGLVFNFTPASSVTVVDLVKRKVLGEIEIPGCSLLYPTGARGFSTLCGSGTLLSVRLGADGKVIGRSETKPFNDLDRDPLFTESTSIGGMRYFPSMLGHIQPIDLSGDEAKLLPAWSLLSAEDAAGHWRPSGWQTITTDERNTLYVLMQPDAHEGTHKDPGTEVWVFDATTQKRVRRMRLVRPGATIALTHASDALLLVQSEDRVDVYDPKTGALVRSVGVPGLTNRMLIQPVR